MVTTTAPERLRIDRYDLLYVVANGGMGTVWAARLEGKHGFRKLFAVKTLRAGLAGDENFRAMFLDEARIASRIDHPNVAQIIELGEQQDALYLVLEWVNGASLHDLLKAMRRWQMRMPLGVALRIVADACAGLHAAHEVCDEDGRLFDLVHRDVSPQNIMVASNGVAKLIDFGIARAHGRLSSNTETGAIKGKIRYMAPEQFREAVDGEQEIDRRADIWSMGAVLRLLLTGAPPYGDPSENGVIRALVQGVPADPLPPDLPPEIAGILSKALSVDAQARFATANEMKDAIESAMLACALSTTTADVAHCLDPLQRELATARPVPAESAREPGMSGGAPPSRPPAGEVTFEARHESPLGLVARSTSSHAERTASTRRRWGFVFIGTAAVAIALAIIGWRGVRRPPVALPSTTNASAAAPEAHVAAAPLEALLAPEASTAPVRPVPSGAAVPPMASKSAISKPRPAPHASVAPTAKPVASSPGAANCNPPYTIDMMGRKIYTRECL